VCGASSGLHVEEEPNAERRCDRQEERGGLGGDFESGPRKVGRAGASLVWSLEADFDVSSGRACSSMRRDRLAEGDVLSTGLSQEAAKSLVLIGDQKQLERHTERESHPDGADKSDARTPGLTIRRISAERRFLCAQERRRGTSDNLRRSSLRKFFRRERLQYRSMTHSRVMEGHPRSKGAGLWFVWWSTRGNRKSWAKEVEIEAGYCGGLLKPESAMEFRGARATAGGTNS